jgi:hypothetical protein
MPSDPADPVERSRGARWAWLWSQELGLLCGFSTVLLLAIGSVVLAATRKTASAQVHLDDVMAFFTAPSLFHLWLYLLLPVMGLYALNTTLATYRTLARLLRARVKAATPYAASLMHLGFLLALLAHLVGGVFSEERGGFLVDERFRPLGAGLEARLLSLEESTHPDGRRWRTISTLEVREQDGTIRTEQVGYNQPLSRGLGSELWLIARAQRHATAATFRVGDQPCTARVGSSCAAGGKRVQLHAVHLTGHWGDRPVAVGALLSPEDRPRPLMLVHGMPQKRVGSAGVSLEEIEVRPTILLRSRSAPGNPLALASALLLLVGLVAMGRRWWRPPPSSPSPSAGEEPSQSATSQSERAPGPG